MFWSLLKKDFRLNQLIFFCGLIVLVLPYTSAFVTLWINPPQYRKLMARDYLTNLQTAAQACLLLSALLSAAAGGLALAGERRERTAEFLNMLPASRGTIVLSKLCAALLSLAPFLLLHCAVLIGLDYVGPLFKWRLDGGFEGASIAIACSLLLFGMAWSVAVFLKSPALSAVVALATGFLLYFGGMSAIEYILDLWRQTYEGRPVDNYYQFKLQLQILFIILMAAFGVLSFVLTSIRYVRRVEP